MGCVIMWCMFVSSRGKNSIIFNKFPAFFLDRIEGFVLPYGAVQGLGVVAYGALYLVLSLPASVLLVWVALLVNEKNFKK